MHLRAFVLRPLLEISPNCHIPQFGHIEDVLQACQSQVVERIEDI
jgi:2-amino-4-hydroxy-6-hydroxymethyldihydropteridine diphosphokinase